MIKNNPSKDALRATISSAVARVLPWVPLAAAREPREARMTKRRHEEDEQAYLFDFRKKLDDARYQITAALNYSHDEPIQYDLVDQHTRLAQGKLTIARVDLSAASAAATRSGRWLPPTLPPKRVSEDEEDDPRWGEPHQPGSIT